MQRGEPTTQAEGTPGVRHRRGGLLGWLTAAIVAVPIPTVAILALTGYPEQATAIGALGGALATAGGMQITVNVRHRQDQERSEAVE
jgi:hypothetical protein